jgi:hypothetical protein
VVLPIQIVKPGANLTGGRTPDLASDLIFFDLFEPRNRGGAMIAENPPRPTQSRTTSCHVFSALARQQGHQDILYRSASESRFGRRERTRGKQIDPRNRPNCQAGSKPLCLLSCRTHAATQCTSTLRALLWVSIIAFTLCARRTLHQAWNFRTFLPIVTRASQARVNFHLPEGDSPLHSLRVRARRTFP